MADILWVLFPDEVFSGRSFDAAARTRFEDVFDPKIPDSPWNTALSCLGVPRVKAERMVNWHRGAPYFNAGAMASAVSGNAVFPVKAGEGYAFKSRLGLFGLCGILWRQWRMARFIDTWSKTSDTSGDIAESIALGLCMQSLMMRLDKRAHENMHAWLADPEKAPAMQKSVFTLMQKLQMRRTELSPVWSDVVPEAVNAHDETPPPFFWNTPPEGMPEVPVNTASNGPWQGKGVTAGQVTGLAVVADRLDVSHEKPADSCIYIFKNARPDTVEFFEKADAVLYANGGALSHACTVARDMGKPCITALGSDFYAALKEQDGVWLRIDVQAGSVAIVES
ncbi:MAG: PEP-utilizing enzyme [Alphaproteobacteria bacterium]|nr:PEP-utilizing enzyme [Alphaproteobacteria bacterium]